MPILDSPDGAGSIFNPAWLQDIELEGPDSNSAPHSPPPSKKLYRTVGLPVLLGGQAFDYGTTVAALKNPHLYEANPIMRAVAGNPATLALAKLGPMSALAWMLDKHVAASHPKLATAAAVSLGALGAALGARNIHTMRSVR